MNISLNFFQKYFENMNEIKDILGNWKLSKFQ